MPKIPLSVSLTVRLTADEDRAMRSAAAAAGQSVSQYVRAQLRKPTLGRQQRGPTLATTSASTSGNLLACDCDSVSHRGTPGFVHWKPLLTSSELRTIISEFAVRDSTAG